MTDDEARAILERPVPVLRRETQREFFHHLGDRILALRHLRRWNQQDLAKHAGVSQTGLGRIERGASPQVGFEIIMRIAFAFGMTPSQLVGDVPVEIPRPPDDEANEMRARIREMNAKLDVMKSQMDRLQPLLERTQVGEDVRSDIGALAAEMAEFTRAVESEAE